MHVVWHDDRDGNDEIYYKLSLDGGVSWGSDIRLTSDPGLSYSPSVAVSSSPHTADVHVVWEDNGDGNFEIYYKRDPTGNPIGIININTEIPKEFKLEQNYPNPFNPVTVIKYQIPKANYVSIKLYDQLGRELGILYEGDQQAGYYQATVNGTNLASGVYFCRITTAGYNKVIKMSLIK